MRETLLRLAAGLLVLVGLGLLTPQRHVNCPAFVRQYGYAGNDLPLERCEEYANLARQSGLSIPETETDHSVPGMIVIALGLALFATTYPRGYAGIRLRQPGA